MKVIITEKPSAAGEIAKVLHINDRKDGYMQNDKYAITWAFGHLIELCPPEAYGWKEWTKENLPMIPSKFQIRPTMYWNATKKQFAEDRGIQKQIGVIDDLFSKAEEIIVATDAGREGELIFRYIYQYLHCQKPFKRLWLSSLTPKSILQAFNALKNGDQYDSLYHSAKCRSEADWLVGMNASRALTIGAAFQSRFSLGRVQTPTLAILCERFNHNTNFTPEPYYQFKIICEKQGKTFSAKSANYSNKETATSIFFNIQKDTKAIVTDVRKTTKSEQPPLLYDLTTLQRDANKYHGFTADATLKLAQSLYEKKFITYPRTGSCYISQDVFEEIPALLEVAANDPVFGKVATVLKTADLNSRSVNDDKVTDHHALLITEQPPQGLGEKETAIYQLILCRMLEAFSAACIKEVTKIELECGGEKFTASGNFIQEGNEGWRIVKQVGNLKEEKTGKEEEEDQKFPALLPHESLIKKEAELLSKMTKPKPLHTDSSLLLAMETCGKDIEDEAAKEAMKDLGIGTPATRANIIETIIKRGYVERKKKQLLPTPKGLAVYALLKEKSIASAELTGKWECRLERISRGQESHELFMEDIRNYTAGITKDIITIGGNLQNANLSDTNAPKMMCPSCKTGEIKKGQKNYYCSNYPRKKEDGSYDANGCRFTIWPVVAGKTLTENNIRQIIEKGRTNAIKGFKSKAGKSFDAYLVLQPDGKLSFEYLQKAGKA